MKKILSLLLVFVMVFALAACGGGEPAVDPNEKSEGVMTYAEYAAAEMDSEVVIEAFVQAKQALKDEAVTVYAQDGEGAYFMYGMPCSEADYALLEQGTKIKVTGYKTAWAGEVEIVDATFEVVEGVTWVAEPTDVTALLGSDELEAHMNKFVAFKGMTVEASKAADGSDVAFLYSWDGSGERGNDLYFNVSLDGQTYNFCVESDLTGADAEVYSAVEALNVGDVIDMEGFLYWYEGANPHIISVAAAA